jgi:predicted ester cyclase
MGGIEVRGADGFRRVVAGARSAFTHLEVTVEDLIAEGDRVAARIRWRGVLASDGRLVDRETIDIVRFADGQAIEHWGVCLYESLKSTASAVKEE